MYKKVVNISFTDKILFRKLGRSFQSKKLIQNIVNFIFIEVNLLKSENEARIKLAAKEKLTLEEEYQLKSLNKVKKRTLTEELLRDSLYIKDISFLMGYSKEDYSLNSLIFSLGELAAMSYMYRETDDIEILKRMISTSREIIDSQSARIYKVGAYELRILFNLIGLGNKYFELIQQQIDFSHQN